jgi:hypothetical protein
MRVDISRKLNDLLRKTPFFGIPVFTSPRVTL